MPTPESTTDQQYDVAIIGASIAGCTAATLFAKEGLRVALIERNADPQAYKRICSHFIQPSATPTIRRLGLAAPIEEAGGIRNGLRMWTRWGWIDLTTEDTPERPNYGYNIRRQLLDPLLRLLTIDTPGVTFLPGRTARRLLADQGRFSAVEVEGPGGQLTPIAARLIVGADGRNSQIAKLAQVEATLRPHGRFGYMGYFRNLALPAGQTSLFWYLDPDAAYAFPNDDGLTLLACFLTKDKLAAFKQDPRGSFERVFAAIPQAPKLAEAEQIGDLIGMIEMPNLSRPAAQPGLAFIGDAAMAADPLWGIGIGWAFQSAAWLVDHTAAALRDQRGIDRALDRYRRYHQAMLGGHHRLMSNSATAGPLNPIQRLMFSAAVKDAVIARHLGAFAARQIRVREFLAPAMIVRAIRVNLSRGDSGQGTGYRITSTE